MLYLLKFNKTVRICIVSAKWNAKDFKPIRLHSDCPLPFVTL
jgi:hypothetical protein